jgi:hypothetical protein
LLSQLFRAWLPPGRIGALCLCMSLASGPAAELAPAAATRSISEYYGVSSLQAKPTLTQSAKPALTQSLQSPP